MKLRLLIVAVVVLVGVIAALQFFGSKPVLPAKTVSAVTDSVTQKPLTLLNGSVNLVTPLGQGYLYHDKITSGLYYSDAAGTKDLTAAVLITTDSSQSLAINNDAIYNTIINIESAANGDAIVTTTRNIFVVHTPTQITKLGEYPKDKLNYTASAYDAKTNRLFVLSAFSKLLFSYDLNQPKSAPTVFYTLSLSANRLAAGGGKLVAYFDDVPSLEPDVLTEYGKTYQISPIVLDTASAKLNKTLAAFQPATYAAVSPSGNYLAIKKKLSRNISIYKLSDNTIVNLPRYDTSGAAWGPDDTFYIARDHGLLSYSAASKSNSLTKVADVATPVTHVLASANHLILELNDNTTALLSPLNDTKLSLTINHPDTTPKSRSVYLAVPSK